MLQIAHNFTIISPAIKTIRTRTTSKFIIAKSFFACLFFLLVLMLNREISFSMVPIPALSSLHHSKTQHTLLGGLFRAVCVRAREKRTCIIAAAACRRRR